MNRGWRRGPRVDPGATATPRSPRFLQVARPLLVSLGLILLAFCLYEIARQTWLIGAATLAGANVVYMALLHRDTGLTFLLPVQGFVDVGILTFLLHFSGGLENPLSMIVVFHVIIGGVLLSRRQCYALAATGSGLFALLGLGEWSGILEHHTLSHSPPFEQGGQLVHLAHCPVHVIGSTSLLAVVLFLTANFVTTLAERMRNDERRLEVLADRALAGQRLTEAQERLAERDALVAQPSPYLGWGPAKYYRLTRTGALGGFIGAITTPHFCETCNRMRLTADGKIRPCLGDHGEIDGLETLRQAPSDDAVRALLLTRPCRPMTAIGG